MTYTRLKKCYPLLLISMVLLILYVKVLTPLYSPKVILKMKAVQNYVRGAQEEMSIEKLKRNSRFKIFIESMAEQLRRRSSKTFVIIVAREDSFPWIENFLCSTSQFDMLPHISMVTIDRETTLSINAKHPMIPVFELNFDELLDEVPSEHDKQVRLRLFDILRLRLGAIVTNNKMLYPTIVHVRRRRGYELFLQEGENSAALLLSHRYTSVENVITYICESPKTYECVLLPKQTAEEGGRGRRGERERVWEIKAQIPFREPELKKYDVVTCIAPLFGNEQWQQALFAAHIYKKYGSHMHLYIRSMVSTVYDLLRIYVDEGYLTIQPWLRITLLTIDEMEFNPNINVEFRNQAAAQTDCLLQYKVVVLVE
ncbi:hypothetical protein TELCIR_13930 [Teladorsagia circumcincta]|uniref:Glycosyltransferase family 92 protein n=1 Tax=Teladorsagia circumcincta TaxID=45464 RepID=A0A2G9U2E9_TELCI|nr:hypothetical protein TELCIR_13930 [Teladorsagia circumcincta]